MHLEPFRVAQQVRRQIVGARIHAAMAQGQQARGGIGHPTYFQIQWPPGMAREIRMSGLSFQLDALLRNQLCDDVRPRASAILRNAQDAPDQVRGKTRIGSLQADDELRVSSLRDDLDVCDFFLERPGLGTGK